MQSRRTKGKSGKISLLNQAVATVALFGVVILMWLGADPGAHERFHAHSGQEDHHCVVTDFAIGEAYYVAPVFELAPAPAKFERIVCEATEHRPAPVDYRLLPICGPPDAA